jgi:hypothetical protein
LFPGALPAFAVGIVAPELLIGFRAVIVVFFVVAPPAALICCYCVHFPGVVISSRRWNVAR